MPAHEPRYQLIVGTVTGRDPRTAATHPWRRVARDGVVTVDRSPGVSRDVASRPMTPQERDERDRTIFEAVAAGGSCKDVGAKHGRSKMSVVGILSRYRARHDLPAPPRAGSAEAPHRLAARDRELLNALLEGNTVPEVAERAGLSRDTVRRIRHRAVARGQLPPSQVTRPATGRALRTVVVPTCHEVERVGLLDIGPGQCRSIEADDLCCCAPSLTGSSWCLAHAAVYTRAAPRRRAA